jgi:hypothetical protein
MRDPLDELPASLAEIAGRLARLEARVARLEAREPVPPARPEPADEPLVAPALPQGTLALVGRSLLVLAGAYVVRALTDGHVLVPPLGIGLGMAYAAFWQLLADREALAGRAASAAFHDVASSLIAFPLVWEAAARFGLPTPVACAALVGFFGLGLAVAWHRRLLANAVVTTLLALGTAVALLASTLDLLAVVVSLVAIAAGLEWLAFRGAWLGLRWIASAVLDGVALLAIAVLTRPQPPEGYAAVPAGAAALALLAIPALYIVSVAGRTLRLGQPVTAFEIVQGSAAVVLGFGGAIRVLGTHGLRDTGPGALALLLGLLCYGAAFAHAERRPGGGRNFYFYSTAGALLTLGGSALIGLGPALSLAWSAAGLLAAALGRHFDRMTLRVHGALFLIAAALQTGLLAACARSLGGPACVSPTLSGWAVAGASGLAWLVLAGDPSAPRPGQPRVPHLLLALVLVFAVGQALHAGLAAAFGELLAADPGVAAVVRTGVLAGLALALAFLARRLTLPELGWLVYPLVALGGLKLLMQDLRHGRPATLVLSLTLYGLVLTLAPRLLKAREGG